MLPTNKAGMISKEIMEHSQLETKLPPKVARVTKIKAGKELIGSHYFDPETGIFKLAYQALYSDGAAIHKEIELEFEEK